MSDDKRSHLGPIEIATLLEGRLSLEERRALVRHVASCDECSRWLVETHAFLIANDALPPPRLYHPLERFLSPLRRVIPWPIWVWHMLLHALVPFLWLALIDVSKIAHLQTPFWTLAPWPASLLMTTYFLWLQGWFRSFVDSLWEAGIPQSEIEHMVHGHLSPLRGWGEQSKWWFWGLGVLVTLTNTVLMPPADWQAGAVVGLTGLYSITVTMAMYWGWGWSGWWWYGVARLVRRYPKRTEHLLGKARRQALTWLLVAALSMFWHLATAIHLEGTYPAMRVYGAIITILLGSLWLGYAFLEREMARENRTSSRRKCACLALLRAVSASGVVFIPLAFTM